MFSFLNLKFYLILLASEFVINYYSRSNFLFSPDSNLSLVSQCSLEEHQDKHYLCYSSLALLEAVQEHKALFIGAFLAQAYFDRNLLRHCKSQVVVSY